MKKEQLIFLVILAALLQSPSSWAGRHNGEGFYDTARVVNVEPLIRHVQYQRPHEDCYWRESLPAGRRSYTSVIGGGAIGGIIGHQFGKGHGKEVMTAVGALLGASIGNDLYQNRSAYRQAARSRKVCDTRYTNHTREEVDGYQVTYRYKGKLFERQMARHPGRKLKFWVDVAPVS